MSKPASGGRESRGHRSGLTWDRGKLKSKERKVNMEVGTSIACLGIGIILLNMWVGQKRHNKSLELRLTEIRDRLKSPV
jgi:hypothetical protein